MNSRSILVFPVLLLIAVAILCLRSPGATADPPWGDVEYVGDNVPLFNGEQFSEIAAPGAAPANRVAFYAKADGLFYSKDDAGLETLVSGGGNVIDTLAATLVAGSITSGEDIDVSTGDSILGVVELTLDAAGTLFISPATATGTNIGPAGGGHTVTFEGTTDATILNGAALFAAGTVSVPAVAIGQVNTGWFQNAARKLAVTLQGSATGVWTHDQGLRLKGGIPLSWAVGDPTAGAATSGISQVSAAVFAMGNGTQGDTTGTLSLTALAASIATSDVAPTELVISSGSSFRTASGGNEDGADLVLSGGQGVDSITVTDWASADGSSTVTITLAGTPTVMTNGAEFTAATSDEVTALGVQTAITAQSIDVTTEVVGDTIFVTADNPGDTLTVAVGGTVFATVAQGSDGGVSIGSPGGGITVTFPGTTPMTVTDGVVNASTVSAVGFTASVVVSVSGDNDRFEWGATDDANLRWSSVQATAANMVFGILTSGNSAGGGSLIVTKLANAEKDHHLATSTDPGIAFFSGGDVDSDATEFGRLKHDGADVVFDTGKGDLRLAPAVAVTLIDDKPLAFGTNKETFIQGEGDLTVPDNTITTVVTATTGAGDYAFLHLKYVVSFNDSGEVCQESGEIRFSFFNDATSGRLAGTPGEISEQVLTPGETLTTVWTIDTSADVMLIRLVANAAMDGGGTPGNGTLDWWVVASGNIVVAQP